MKTNLHTHTYLCHHASGEPEEYAKRAYENGIKTLGFSDHAPYINPEGKQKGYRVAVEDAEKYIKIINDLKKEYAGKMDILVGFESEYYPAHFKKMLEYYRFLGAEYLILGQHFPKCEENGEAYIGEASDDEIRLRDYTQSVIDGMNTGVFTYIAHPDVINFTGDRELYKKQMRKICKEAHLRHIPLEINFLGIRGDRVYPNDDFWKIAGEEKCEAVFGFDAHTVESAYDDTSFERAYEIVEKFGLTLIETPSIKFI